MPKVRITIEYNPDWPVIGNKVEQLALLAQEKDDWLDNNVNVGDIMDMAEHDPENNSVKWEIIP